MRKRIGEFLLEKGVITQDQVNQILTHSRATGLRFGDAGLDLGVLSREALIEVFGPNFAVDFFHLEPEYFPQVTRDLIPIEAIVRLGALPLGFKTEKRLFRSKKLLNIGLLDPSRKDAAEECLKIAAARLGQGGIQGTTVFLVLADQFLTVLRQTYGVAESEVGSKEPPYIDETLALFLENAR